MRNIADAVRAFEGLFSADGLKMARARADLKNAEGDRYETYRGVGTGSIYNPINPVPTPQGFRNVHGLSGANSAAPHGNCRFGIIGQFPIFRVIYRREGVGCKLAEAVFLQEVTDPRGWLEARLGPLAYFEVVDDVSKPAAAVVSDRGGRPPVSGEAMNNAERMRRMRARRKEGKDEAG